MMMFVVAGKRCRFGGERGVGRGNRYWREREETPDELGCRKCFLACS